MRFTLILLYLLGLSISSANAAMVFFNIDRAGFDAVTSTSLTDFETAISNSAGTIFESPSMTIDGNTYSNPTDGSNLFVNQRPQAGENWI
jgi:hypothetical protein